MKLALLVMLVACNARSKDKPEPRPVPTFIAGDAAVVDAGLLDAATAGQTALTKAQQLLAQRKGAEPLARVLIARAQLAANQRDAAKDMLAEGLAAARADQSDEATSALAYAIEVLYALGDAEGVTTVTGELVARVTVKRDVIARLFSPYESVEHVPTLDLLATLGTLDKHLAKTISQIVVGSPAWTAVVGAVAKTADEAARIDQMVSLVRRAVDFADPATANALIVEAEKLVKKHPGWARSLAVLAIRTGDTVVAKRLLARVPAFAATEEPREAAETYADLAEYYAALGDHPSSLANEKKAIANAAKVREELTEAAPFDGKMGDAIWGPIAVARTLRDGAAAGAAYAKEVGLGAGAIADAVAEVALLGHPEPAHELLAMTKVSASTRHDALTAMVILDAKRGALDEARTLALGSPLYENEMPGIDDVMRAYALRGDIASFRDLAPKVRGVWAAPRIAGATTLIARVLSAQRRCDDAIAFTDTVKLSETYATLAYFCPRTD